MTSILPDVSVTRPLAVASLMTTGFLVMLPFMEIPSRPTDRLELATDVSTARLPPPPPARPDIPPPEEAVSEPLASPMLDVSRETVLPVRPVFDLGMDPGDFAGSFSTRFRVDAGTLAGTMENAVFALDALDQAPQPLVRLEPLYPTFARMRNIQGEVVVEFIVGADGNTRDVVVMSADPEDVFEDAARRAIMRWRFNPGVRGGHPVAVRVRQRVTFSLEGGAR